MRAGPEKVVERAKLFKLFKSYRDISEADQAVELVGNKGK